MELSILLAKVMGIYLIIFAVVGLVKLKVMPAIFKEMSQSVALTFFTGGIALLLGLLIVITHNIWTKDWPVIITIIGWIALIKGIVRVFVPEQGPQWALKIMSNTLLVILALICLVIGAYLTYVGFIA